MNPRSIKKMTAVAAMILCSISIVQRAQGQYAGWKHSGVVTLDTTPKGSDIPASAKVSDFPVLIRLEQGSFDFKEAKPDGSDIRFAAGKTPLLHQIEMWDAELGKAAIWVRIPEITGAARQDIGVFWGNQEAASESSGKKVFDTTSGFAGVWHLGENAGNTTDGFKDSTANEAHGTSPNMDAATHVFGVAGMAKKLTAAKKQHIVIGKEELFNFTNQMTVSAWFKVDAFTCGWQTLLANGDRSYRITRLRDTGQIGEYGAGGWMVSTQPVNDGTWKHVAMTLGDGTATFYINGEVQASNKTSRSLTQTKDPIWIGGNSNHGRDWEGLIDEVRLSKSRRSAEWIKLCYENQKEQQTLVAPIKVPGRKKRFGAVKPAVVGRECSRLVVRGNAVGADEFYWVSVGDDGKETFLDSGLNVVRAIPRLIDETSMHWRLKARYGATWETSDVSVVLKDIVPDPQFKLVSSLGAGKAWDGQEDIEIAPKIANKSDIAAAGPPNNVIHYDWVSSGQPVYKVFTDSGVVIKHAYKPGDVSVTLNLDNSGALASSTVGPIKIDLNPAPVTPRPKLTKGKLKVFVLVGQSNMEGHGKVDGVKTEGSIPWLLNNPKYAADYKHLVDKDGKTLVYDDVWVYYPRESYTYEPKDVQYGPLEPRFGQSNRTKENRLIGPEFGIGLQMRQQFDEQVLLIKTCWGGHSLGALFLPPGVNNKPGRSYTRMLDIVQHVTGNLKKYFPKYDGKGFEIAGVFWHQGYNDQFAAEFKNNYEGNLAILIDDLRREWGIPNLPFVIGESGMMTGEIPAAQKAVAAIQRFKGNVEFVPTKQFFKQELGSGAGYHWHYSFYSHYNVGMSMGQAMKKLLAQ